MTDSLHSLSRIQNEVLIAFFEREDAFVLTGGAALVGFYLKHRDTKDLDLFARAGADMDRAERLTKLRDFKEFRRFLVERGSDSTIVDLVIDRAPRIDEDVAFGTVRVHSKREILANKLCTVLSRGEPRDLVDLMYLTREGVDLGRAVADASAKDGGADAATLAWVLHEISIGPQAVLPSGVSARDLEAFRADLEARLRRLAFPGEGGVTK